MQAETSKTKINKRLGYRISTIDLLNICATLGIVTFIYKCNNGMYSAEIRELSPVLVVPGRPIGHFCDTPVFNRSIYYHDSSLLLSCIFFYYYYNVFV